MNHKDASVWFAAFSIFVAGSVQLPAAGPIPLQILEPAERAGTVRDWPVSVDVVDLCEQLGVRDTDA